MPQVSRMEKPPPPALRRGVIVVSMKDWPPRDNPVACLPFLCERATEYPEIFLIVVEESKRPLLLRNAARRIGAPYLVCERTRTGGQFLAMLAAGLGLPAPRLVGELRDLVEERLNQRPRTIVMDYAERLNRAALSMVLDLHKSREHRGGGVSFVLASGEQSLLKHVEAVDCGSSFTSHCVWYTPGCEATARMRKRWEQLSALLAPPPIPFPSSRKRSPRTTRDD